MALPVSSQATNTWSVNAVGCVVCTLRLCLSGSGISGDLLGGPWYHEQGAEKQAYLHRDQGQRGDLHGPQQLLQGMGMRL